MGERYHPEDRVQLKETLMSFFAAFFSLLSFLWHTILQRKALLILGLLIGLASGSIYYSMKPKVYQGSMIVVFNKLTKKTYAEIPNP